MDKSRVIIPQDYFVSSVPLVWLTAKCEAPRSNQLYKGYIRHLLTAAIVVWLTNMRLLQHLTGQWLFMLPNYRFELIACANQKCLHFEQSLQYQYYLNIIYKA